MNPRVALVGIASLALAAWGGQFDAGNQARQLRDSKHFGVDASAHELWKEPAGFPAGTEQVSEVQPGFSLLIRNAYKGTARNVVCVHSVTPGNVYLYETVTFNNPQYCTIGANIFAEPSPCWSFGPGNPGDGANPAVEHWIAAFGGKVARGSTICFNVDLGNDTPTETFTGPGLTNPSSAMIAMGIRDKGPALPEGHPLRDAQFNTILGACAGPPFFGPVPCCFAAVQQHLP